MEEIDILQVYKLFFPWQIDDMLKKVGIDLKKHRGQFVPDPALVEKWQNDPFAKDMYWAIEDKETKFAIDQYDKEAKETIEEMWCEHKSK